ncbi:MAG: tripartite tricarboxylate transporter substrate binding protein [Betaproteobacteria bacterium]|nr:tripartite tricarboxylate transporter substrate binding protein [Betaproteobacteria bacterium]
MSVVLLGLIGIFAAVASISAPAQTYPTRPVRLIVPYAPGGGTDVLGRMISQRLGEALGQSIIVDNRPAVDGIVGAEILTRSAPDGYTLLIISSSHAINAALGRKLPYDTIKDFAPITQTANQQLLLVTHPSVPVKSTKELIDYVKARPGKLNYGSSSNATALPMELFKSMTGTDMQHIPYKGSGPMMIDLVGGQVQISMAGAVASIPHVKAGRLRALGIGDLKRSAFLPNIPTIAEGGVPGYQAVIWTGMFAPAKTPRPIIARLHKEVVRILQRPDFRERVSTLGSDVVGSTPEEWGKFLAFKAD